MAPPPPHPPSTKPQQQQSPALNHYFFTGKAYAHTVTYLSRRILLSLSSELPQPLLLRQQTSRPVSPIPHENTYYTHPLYLPLSPSLRTLSSHPVARTSLHPLLCTHTHTHTHNHKDMHGNINRHTSTELFPLSLSLSQTHTHTHTHRHRQHPLLSHLSGSGPCH